MSEFISLKNQAISIDLAIDMCNRIAKGDSVLDVFGRSDYIPMAGIYALLHPDTLDIRYVGQSKNIKKRFSGHCSSRSNLPVACWIRSLNERPKIVVIEETDDIDAAEVKWISAFRMSGFNLLNIADGGSGYCDMSSAKSRMPWSGKVSPIQIATTSISRLATEMKRSGDIDGFNRMKSVSDESVRMSKTLQKAGSDAWILANKEFVRSRPHLQKRYPGFEDW